MEAQKATGQYLPEAVFESLARNTCRAERACRYAHRSGHTSVNVALRKRLNLFVNFRPVRMLPGLKTRFADLPIDLAIFRENTEDLYAGTRARSGDGRGGEPQGDHPQPLP